MRKSDLEPKQFFRAGARLYCLNGEWYFQTREEDRGPYTCRESAEAALQRYCVEMSDLSMFDDFNAIDYDVEAHQKPRDGLSLTRLDD